MIEKSVWVQPGDAVRDFTGANEMVGTLALRFESQQQLTDYIEAIDTYVKLICK